MSPVIYTTNRFWYYLAKLYRRTHWLDWIEQCFTSPPTRYRLYGRRFLQIKRPNSKYWRYTDKSNIQ